MRSRKLVWFLMLGVLLALAGCSSDGNGTPADMMPDPTPPPPDPMPMSIDLSDLAAGMMLGEEMEYTIQPGASQDSGQVMFVCPPGGSACMVTVNADGTATYDGNGGKPKPENTEAAITAANNATKAVRAMAAKIAPAIADPDGDGEFPEAGDLRGTGNASSDDNANNSAATASSRPGGAATFAVAAGGAVTVDSNGADTDTATEYADILGMDDKWDADSDSDTPDVSRENQFQRQMTAPPTLAGFAGSVYERTVDKVTDTLTVYTNVEDVKAEAYNTYFARGERTATNPNGRPTIVSTAVDPSAEGYDGTLTFGTFTAADHAGLFGGSFFVRTDSPTKTLPGAAGDNNANERPGTFAGVPGKFICTADCTFTFNGEGGALSGISGTLTFEPTSTDVQVPNVIRDRDFLTFGYWLQATEDDKGETTYGVRTFATGADPSDANIISSASFEGEATYSGKATGMYVTKAFDGRGVGAPANSGQFTADASLTAYFGGNDIAVNKQYEISGEVSNFKDGDGNNIDDMWKVELMKAGFGSADSATYSSSDPVFNGATTGNGEWQGQFFGTVVSDADTNTSGNQSTLPTGVAGEFNGHFSNGHVIGAFGATQDE